MLRIDSHAQNADAPVQLPTSAELLDRTAWLIRLRWRAVGAIVAVVGITWGLGIITEAPALLALAALHAAGNLVFLQISRFLSESTPRARLQNLLAGQILFDLTVLMALLHFSGGADNPFMMLSMFHMAFAGMLLPLRPALVIGLLTGLAYATMVLAESTGMIPHYPLDMGGGHGPAVVATAAPLWSSPMYMLGYLSAYVLTRLGIIVFVHKLVHRIREAEALRREHERLAASRERLARIGSLIAGVAHTIRNPLHGVLNCIDMLQRRMDGQDRNTVEILELMGEGVARIENVTSRLLVLSREAPAPQAPVDISLLVQDALQFAEMRAHERGIEIDYQTEDVAALPVDAERFADAVTNVLDNAIDACSTGDRITVRILNTPAPGTGARIEIEDTGSGIADGELERIFEPFFTTKPVGEGTGLGLAITRQVVEDHEGDIHVISRVGAGTTVRIDLPRRQEKRAA